MSKNHMMEQKKEMINELTQSSLSLLSDYNKQVEQGELTLDDASQISGISQSRLYGLFKKKYGMSGFGSSWYLCVV